MSSKLAQHIANLKAESPVTSTNEMRAQDSILFWGTGADKSFLPYLKGCVGSYTTHLRTDKITTLSQVSMHCEKKGITKVVSTSPELLRKLLYWDKKKAPSLDNYAGSHFYLPAFSKDRPAIEVVFIKPLKHLVTVPYGKFMTARNISKLTKSESWYLPTEFNWCLLTPENETALYHKFNNAFLISIDIETFKENAVIRCLSYTGFFYTDDNTAMHSTSVVLPLDSTYALAIMRKWNAKLPAPKVFQNGKYDNAYLTRYSAPVYNYLYDTANMFHAWFSELPKDLGFLNSFFIREAKYWKDLSETNDLHEYYKYNALDTWGTGNCFLAMMLEVPEYAISNYLLEFPLTFPCHLSEMTGIERDMDELIVARLEADKKVEELSDRLDTILGVTGFNVKSPPQMKQLFKILGCADLKNQDAKNIQKARFRHPLNGRVLGLVLEIREARTLREKYLQVGEKSKEFHRYDGTGNRILYALNPHGTDSSRLASKEHHFWTGLQIQNIPRGPSVKRTMRADPEFYIAEADLEQAESRDTAYISGDTNLIEAVEDSPDFHSYNASKFFGVPFEEIYDELSKKVLDKPLRQLGKPVNHGANYNMGAMVLIETMGEGKIVEAQILLGLNPNWNYKRVAEHLLELFHKTYPGIRGVFYPGVVEDIMMSKMLVSNAVHYSTSVSTWAEDYKLQGGAWVRYCFSDPSKSKHALNSYISHPPQSLNAQTLNKAYWDVFIQIAMNPKYSPHFKLLAQIHDSILFQYRAGHEYLCKMVEDLMEIPIVIKAYDDKIRTFTVPAEVKYLNDEGKPAIYWSEAA